MDSEEGRGISAGFCTTRSSHIAYAMAFHSTASSSRVGNKVTPRLALEDARRHVAVPDARQRTVDTESSEWQRGVAFPLFNRVRRQPHSEHVPEHPLAGHSPEVSVGYWDLGECCDGCRHEEGRHDAHPMRARHITVDSIVVIEHRPKLAEFDLLQEWVRWRYKLDPVECVAKIVKENCLDTRRSDDVCDEARIPVNLGSSRKPVCAQGVGREMPASAYDTLGPEAEVLWCHACESECGCSQMALTKKVADLGWAASRSINSVCTLTDDEHAPMVARERGRKKRYDVVNGWSRCVINRCLEEVNVGLFTDHQLFEFHAEEVRGFSCILGLDSELWCIGYHGKETMTRGRGTWRGVSNRPHPRTTNGHQDAT